MNHILEGSKVGTIKKSLNQFQLALDFLTCAITISQIHSFLPAKKKKLHAYIAFSKLYLSAHKHLRQHIAGDARSLRLKRQKLCK
jgi:hypothetical protein